MLCSIKVKSMRCLLFKPVNCLQKNRNNTFFYYTCIVMWYLMAAVKKSVEFPDCVVQEKAHSSTNSELV